MKPDHDATLVPRAPDYATFGDGARRLSARDIQDALAATARLALFAAGQIKLDHDEVEAHMAIIMDLLEVAHDAAPKA